MRKVWKFVLVTVVLMGLVLGVNTGAISQESITVTGAAPTLTISTATAGQEPGTVTDSSSGLSWTKGTCIKITVETDLDPQKFTLKVEAIGVSGGTAVVGGRILSTTPQTLINLTEDGSCTLKYTGSATVSDGIGTDSHTITYTIQ